MGYHDRNKLTNEILSVMVPKVALIAYQGENELKSEYYLEAREISEDGIMGAGMPVTHDFMREISDNYVDAHGGTPYGIIPSNMLYCDTRRGGEKYIWHNPTGKRTMYFKDNLGLDNVEYHVPGVIYVVKNNSMCIYAYKDKKPGLDTGIFAGPFFNTTSGSICLGSAKLKKPTNPTFSQLIEYWEKRFWMTEFSHLGGGSNPTKDNLVIVTKNAIDKPFDLGQLTPMGKKLKDLI